MEMGRYADAKESLEKVLQASKSGAKTVSRLQTFARVREELPTSGTETFDLSKLTFHAIEMTKPLWKTGPEKEGIDIKMTHRLEPGCFVKGTESELLEVIFNLVKNAAEAMPEDGEIVMEVSREGDRAALRIRDTGIGIREPDIRKVFQPFWTTKGVSIGTGMGLAVTHGIVQQHRGEISVQSEEGKGSVFSVMLPLAEKPSHTHDREGLQDANVSLTILVIDDMPAIVQFIERALTRIGHAAIGCTSGQAALEVLRAKQVDVVICDLVMPEMNGWEVGREIRRLHEERCTPKPPFILLTGWGGQSLDKGKIADSGVDEVMEKPVDVKKLQRLVVEAVRDRSLAVS
jgi:two-component system cell cycle sensor histidine kinase/response regulator CckA